MATTTDDVTSVADALMALPLTEFKKEVEPDIRPGYGPDWEARHAALRSPTVVDRWFMALNQMAKSVDGQLASRTELYEADKAALRAKMLTEPDVFALNGLKAQFEETKERYARARSSTLRFKSGLDEALIEARSIRDSARDRMYDSVVAEERNRYAARITLLEAAIREHQHACDLADISPEDHDERLWSVIER